MPLIVAPAIGFDSLVSLADAAQYMQDFGHTWPTDTTKQEVSLRKATQYIMSTYALRAEYLDPVHSNVKAACCEAAVRASVGSLSADTDGRIKTEQTVDVITTKWAEGQQAGRMSYPVIDALLRGLTSGVGVFNVKLVRG